MNRKLGSFETAQSITYEYAPFNLVGVLQLENSPPPDVLHAVLDAIQNQHPIMNVRIEKKRGRYHYVSGEVPAIPFHVIERESDDHWIVEAEKELNSFVETANGPLIRATYLYSGGKPTLGDIIFCTHHAIIDGSCGPEFMRAIIEQSAARMKDKSVQVSEQYPPIESPDSYFPREFQGIRRIVPMFRYFLNQMAEEAQYQLGLRGKQKPAINDQATGKIITIALSPEKTKEISKRAREANVTLNSILNASMLLAVNRILYDGVKLPMRGMTFADLRPYLVPPVDPHYFGGYASTFRFAVTVEGNADLWLLAREIQEKIYKATKRGDKFTGSLMSPQMMKMVFRLRAFRMATTALSYAGVVDMSTQTNSIKIRGVHSFASNFDVGPEYTAQARIFNDQLWWNIVYLDTDMDKQTANLIANKMCDQLTE